MELLRKVFRVASSFLGQQRFLRSPSCAMLRTSALARAPAVAPACSVAASRRRSSESTWGASARSSVCSVSADDAEAYAELQASAAEDRERLLDWTLDPWALPDAEVERLVILILLEDQSLPVHERSVRHMRFPHCIIVTFCPRCTASWTRLNKCWFCR